MTLTRNDISILFDRKLYKTLNDIKPDITEYINKCKEVIKSKLKLDIKIPELLDVSDYRSLSNTSDADIIKYIGMTGFYKYKNEFVFTETISFWITDFIKCLMNEIKYNGNISIEREICIADMIQEIIKELNYDLTKRFAYDILTVIDKASKLTNHHDLVGKITYFGLLNSVIIHIGSNFTIFNGSIMKVENGMSRARLKFIKCVSNSYDVEFK